MKNRSFVSGSGPFLIELLIGLLVFALTATICLQIFVGAHRISSENNALNNAIIKAQNGAESFKASGGNLKETAILLGGDLIEMDNAVLQHFNYYWNPVVATEQNDSKNAACAKFVLEIRQLAVQQGYIKGEVLVRNTTGLSIFSLPVAVLEVTP